MKKWGGEDQDPKRVKDKDKEKLNPRRGENFVERMVNPTERWKVWGVRVDHWTWEPKHSS